MVRSCRFTARRSIFQAVTLPKGRSDVRFFYRPPLTRLSVTIALLAALAWVGAVVRGLVRRRRTTLQGVYSKQRTY